MASLPPRGTTCSYRSRRFGPRPRGRIAGGIRRETARRPSPRRPRCWRSPPRSPVDVVTDGTATAGRLEPGIGHSRDTPTGARRITAPAARAPPWPETTVGRRWRACGRTSLDLLNNPPPPLIERDAAEPTFSRTSRRSGTGTATRGASEDRRRPPTGRRGGEPPGCRFGGAGIGGGPSRLRRCRGNFGPGLRRAAGSVDVT